MQNVFNKVFRLISIVGFATVVFMSARLVATAEIMYIVKSELDESLKCIQYSEMVQDGLLYRIEGICGLYAKILKVFDGDIEMWVRRQILVIAIGVAACSFRFIRLK